jgi:hypothetical protein
MNAQTAAATGRKPDSEVRPKRHRKPLSIAEIAQKKVFTIREFCALHALSPPMFYQMEKQGRTPKVIYVGTHKRITAEAAAEWRKKMQEDAERSGGGK